MARFFDYRQGLSAGEKFADSDLIGIPWRVVMSDRLLKTNSLEIKRRGEETAHVLSPEEAIGRIVDSR